ncbi:Bacterial regulatory protein [compost metagenome]
MFSPRAFADRSEAAVLAWSAYNVWPMLRRAIAEQRISLSPRELESLNLAFEGLTARETAQRMDCSERTVNYHLANAMAKLQTDNKLAAVQLACWIGLI